VNCGNFSDWCAVFCDSFLTVFNAAVGFFAFRIPAAVRKFPPTKTRFKTTVATNVPSIDRSRSMAHRLSRIAREEEFIMNALNRYLRPEFLTLLLGIAAALGGCVPVQTATRPTLDEARLGNVRSANVEDSRLRPGEIEGEIVK
jgi:hypothetical protein